VRHSRFGIVRILAMIAMMLSISGAFSLSASAQSTGSISTVAKDAVTGATLWDATICLDGDDNCQTPGEGTAAYFLNVEYGAHTISASAPGYEPNSVDVTLGQPHLAQNVELTQSEPAVLQAYLYVEPQVSGTFDGKCGDEEVTGTFTNGSGRIGEFEEGTSCDLTLSAEGYADGSASGVITEQTEDDGYGSISGTLGDALPDMAEDVSFAVVADDQSIPVGAPMTINDGAVFSGVVPENGIITTDSLTPGDYTVTVGAIAGYQGATDTFTVNAEDDGETFTLTVPVEAQVTEGDVIVTVYECPGLDEVVWDGIAGDDCIAGFGNFVFAPVDDPDAFFTQFVDDTGTVTLPVGTYDVYEEGYENTSTQITISEGETAQLTVLNPGEDTGGPETPGGIIQMLIALLIAILGSLIGGSI